MDTAEDARLAVAERALEDLESRLTHGHIKAQFPRDEALDAVERAKGAVKALTYSYAEPDQLVEMTEFDDLVQAADVVETLLGGQDFHEEIDEKEVAVAEARWALDTIGSLEERLFLDGGPETAVQARVGRVLSASAHPQADDLQVTGVAAGRSLTVVTNDLDVSADDRVGVALLPPSELRGVLSTGMFLGHDGGVLADVEPDADDRPDVPDEAWHETRNQVAAYLQG
jgi:predicted RNA-binding protein with EMAP domain